MTNLQHFMLAYKHIKSLSVPDDANLKAHIMILKSSADVVFSKLLVNSCLDNLFKFK